MPEQVDRGIPEPPRRPDSAQRGPGRRSKLPGLDPRTWSGRPITLAVGWLMSCALVTAVTLTAVQRVGHEVSGSQPPVLSNEQVAEAAGQASVSASAASASASQHSRLPSPTPSTQPTAASTPQGATAAQHPNRPSHQTVPSTSSLASPTPPPPTSPSPPLTTAPVSTAPSTSSSPPPSTPPSSSSSPSGSPSSSASPSAATGKKVQYWSPDPPPATYRGVIIFDCQGNTVVNLKAYLWQVPDQTTYTMTDRSVPGQLVDVTFSEGSVSTEYVWTCSNGTPVGGVVVPESP